MGLLYGLLFNIITFPGIISRRFTTNILLSAFTKGKPDPYVEKENLNKEEKQEDFKQYIKAKYTARIALIITIVPLISQTLLTIVFACFSAWALLSGGDEEGAMMSNVVLFMNYLSLSFGVHALPSKFDIQIFRAFKDEYTGFKAFTLEFFKIVFIVVNYLKAVWIDLFYAVIIWFIATEVFKSILG